MLAYTKLNCDRKIRELDLKLFCHLGYHKTGTSHLQIEIFTKCQNTYLVTRPHTLMLDAINKLKFALNNDYRPEDITELFNELCTTSPDKKNVILSDETLLGQPNRNYLNRSAIFSRCAAITQETHAIVFLRGQLDLIESLYNQYVKEGVFRAEFNRLFISLNGQGIAIDELDKYKTRHDVDRDKCYYTLGSWMDVSRFKYSNLIEELNQNFKHVHVFLYEDLLHDPQTVYKRLSDILDEKSLSQIKPKERKVNPRLKSSELWLRLVTLQLLHTFPAVSRWIRAPLARLYVLFCSKGFERRKQEYLDKLKNEAGFGEDNYIANKKYNLGMEKYPKEYMLDTKN